MPDRPNFPIPENLTPDTFCLQLQIPNDPTWKRVFAGLLAEPMYWFSWQRDAAHSGKIVSQYWTKLFNDIDWSDMSCCCDQPPAIFRYNADGVYQRSTDGGTTWVDAPEYDYRNTSTVFPPPSALGFDNTKCQNADSAVVILNEDVIQGLDNGSAVHAILEFVAAVLIFYLSAGTLATVAIGLFSMAAAIFGYGVAATKAAFTSTVLDQLRCSIYCAMNSDDSIDAAGFSTLLADINTNYTGIVKTSLYSIISSAGVVGITNMIRSNRGDASADCASCPCATGCDILAWEAWTTLGALGTILSYGEDYIEVQSQSASAFGAQAAGIYLPDGCCNYNHTEAVGASAGISSYYSLCGHDPADTGGNINTPFAIACGTSINMITAYGGTTVFTAKFYFDGTCV